MQNTILSIQCALLTI